MDRSLSGKRVLVFGLGLHGGAAYAVRWLVRQGARVTVTDAKNSRALAPTISLLRDLPIRYVLGRHTMRDIRSADLIVKNPGVPADSRYMAYARSRKIPITTDLGLFIERAHVPVCAVTGTKGKTTTTTLIWKMAKKRWHQARIAGTAGVSPLRAIPKMGDMAPSILELSSWQLEDITGMKWSPHVAVVTMIAPDHLDRHGNLTAYARVKQSITNHQSKHDFAVLNADDNRVRRFAHTTKARVIWFSVRGNHAKGTSVYVTNGQIHLNAQGKRHIILPISRLGLQDAHLLSDALAAVGAAYALHVPIRAIRAALEEFTGVPSRMERVTVKRGVSYVNDTTATNPTAAIAALRSLAGPIVLIAGGADKGLPLDGLIREISRMTKAVILLPGTATRRMLPGLRKAHARFHLATSMQQAVVISSRIAVQGDTILLSPGCASFGLFRHEFDRGKQFVDAVNLILP